MPGTNVPRVLNTLKKKNDKKKRRILSLSTHIDGIFWDLYQHPFQLCGNLNLASQPRPAHMDRTNHAIMGRGGGRGQNICRPKEDITRHQKRSPLFFGDDALKNSKREERDHIQCLCWSEAKKNKNRTGQQCARTGHPKHYYTCRY